MPGMINLLKLAQDDQKTATLMIGANLRAAGSNAAWRRLNLPGGNAQTRERIAKLFPASDVAAHVLDVLASGAPSENVAVRLGGDGEDRFLCASFHPWPSAAKPKRVRMEAWEMKAYFLLDGETGEILETNEAAKETFGGTSRLRGEPGLAEALQSGEARAAALTAAARNGSHYLGKFKHRRPNGREVELESLLVVGVERHSGNTGLIEA